MYQSKIDPDALAEDPSEREIVSGSMPIAALSGDDVPPIYWRALDRHARWPTQTHDFLTALPPLLTGQRTRIVHVRRDRRLTGLVPLCRDEGYFARWRLAGVRELSEPGDIASASDADAAGLAQVLRHLGRPLALDRVSADSSFLPALRAAMRGRGWVVVRPAMPCPVITLDDSWRDPEAKFNSGRRSDFRRAMRKASGFGAVQMETLSPDLSTFDALFDEAVAVEHRSWKQEAGTSILACQRREAFFRRFLRSAAADGRARISFLRIDGVAVAMQLALLWKGRYWLFKIGHDAAFDKCSPGTLLMLHCLRDAAESGLQSFELLGVAEPWIARFWTREQRDCVHVRTYPANLRGGVALAQDAFRWFRENAVRRRK